MVRLSKILEDRWILMEEIRLNSYIAKCGVASRRKADELIKNGLVFVNGKKVCDMGHKVTAKDNVLVNFSF